jgi:putative ABC transport system ATP-binding protein
VDLRGVSKAYQTAAGVFYALREINLQIDPGEFVAVVGKSGSGKSTLLNMITGIDRPTAGEVWIGGTGIHRLGESPMAAWRGRNLGIVFQFFQLLPTLTVIENVMLPMDFCHRYHFWERQEIAMNLLRLVELEDQARKLPAALSGGQQQRVAIARALANDPPVVVADEPTGNLDTKTARSVFELFESLVAQGKTVMMVTHDQDLAHSVPRTVFLSDGRIVHDSLGQHALDGFESQRGVGQLPPEATVRQATPAPNTVPLTKPRRAAGPSRPAASAAPPAALPPEPTQQPAFVDAADPAPSSSAPDVRVPAFVSEEQTPPGLAAPPPPPAPAPGGDGHHPASRKKNDSKTSRAKTGQLMLHTLITAILADRATAVERLQQEFRRVSNDRQQLSATYDAVLSEISLAAAEAEQNGDPEEARELWGILVEATAPWANRKVN